MSLGYIRGKNQRYIFLINLLTLIPSLSSVRATSTATIMQTSQGKIPSFMTSGFPIVGGISCAIKSSRMFGPERLEGECLGSPIGMKFNRKGEGSP